VVGPGPDQQRLTPAERGNLVAYLDGELNEAESRAIATKLTQSVTARREIEMLQKTWEILEYLPRPQASEAFTQRTLTEIDRISVVGEQRVSAAARAVRHLLVMTLGVLASLACFGLGVVLMRWVWPDPTSRLVRDLSIAEHLDEYRDVGTIEFLEGLDSKSEFASESK
jgi:anti-sigma factor RsiW